MMAPVSSQGSAHHRPKQVRLDHVGEPSLCSPATHGRLVIRRQEGLWALTLVLEARPEEEGAREEERGPQGRAGQRHGGAAPQEHGPSALRQLGGHLDETDGVPVACHNQEDAAPDPEPAAEGVADHERRLGLVEPGEKQDAAHDEGDVGQHIQDQLQHLVAYFPLVPAFGVGVLPHVVARDPNTEEAAHNPQNDASDVELLGHELKEEDAGN
mmetsp:Transcript_104110/g.303962  ORF Transcript_104110/g.303962 Transcript_104110/m.303962 type:complete len:213 (+) Transcript_104110:431-1069(+)